MKFKNFIAQHKRAIGIWGILLAIFCIAANPSFNVFNSGQFDVSGNDHVAIKVNAGITQGQFFGLTTFPSGQKFQNITTTNFITIYQDATHAINIIYSANVFLLTDPNTGDVIGTYDPSTKVWTWGAANTFSLPMIGNGYLLTNLLTLSSNTTLIGTNAKTIRLWGLSNFTNNNGVMDLVLPPAAGTAPNYDPDLFITNNGKIYIKAGGGLTNINFYQAGAGNGNTFPQGQKFSDITISNLIVITSGSTNSMDIAQNGVITSFYDPVSGQTNCTYNATTKVWTWLVTNVFQQPIVGTGPGAGLLYLVGTNANGNRIVINGQQQTLTFTGNTNVNVDMSAGHSFLLSATTNIYLSPTNLCCGQTANILVVEDATGGRSLSWNTNFIRFGTNYDNTLDTNGGRYSVITVIAGPYCTNGLGAVRKGF